MTHFSSQLKPDESLKIPSITHQIHLQLLGVIGVLLLILALVLTLSLVLNNIKISKRFFAPIDMIYVTVFRFVTKQHQTVRSFLLSRKGLNRRLQNCFFIEIINS